MNRRRFLSMLGLAPLAPVAPLLAADTPAAGSIRLRLSDLREVSYIDLRRPRLRYVFTSEGADRVAADLANWRAAHPNRAGAA